jgi:hypothetical protein
VAGKEMRAPPPVGRPKPYAEPSGSQVPECRLGLLVVIEEYEE